MIRKFYIRYREDHPETEMFSIAFHGFRLRGIETAPYYWIDDINDLPDLSPEVGVAGYIGDVWRALDVMSIERPSSLDYPEQLQKFLGRKIEKTTLKEVRRTTHRKMFVKPVQQKLFTGFCCNGEYADQIRLAPYHEDAECWISEPVNFVSEYRCFIQEGEILNAHWYKGDWSQAIDRSVVKQAVEAWSESPIAYTLDFGVTDRGQTLLVEVNDSFAMGSYGLPAELYAGMLSARWEEMTNGSL